MKKRFKLKNALLIVALFFSLAINAKTALVCIGGQAYTATYYIDANGNVVLTGYATAGGCPSDVDWVVLLDKVAGSGGPTVGELSEGGYDALSSISPQTGDPPEDLIDALQYSEDHNTLIHQWVNPTTISGDAYSLIYGSDPMMDIFYVSASLVSGSYKLQIYSDQSKDVTVEYRNIYGTLIASETVSISSGSNSSTLTKPLLVLSNGYYSLKVISSSSYQFTSLTVSN
jgi:hypothetical protein